MTLRQLAAAEFVALWKTLTEECGIPREVALRDSALLAARDFYREACAADAHHGVLEFKEAA